MLDCSVVIVQGVERDYLHLALDSIVSQDAFINIREVILVSSIGSKIFENLWKIRDIPRIVVVLVEPGSVGYYWEVGMSRARGEVIFLLDDDDEWVVNKVHSVLQIFEDSDVFYYQNAVTEISASSKPRQSLPIAPLEKRIIGGKYFSSFGMLKISKKFSKVRPLKLHFNNSSIAVRRKLIDVSLGELSTIAAGIDSYLFYKALSIGKETIVDSLQLTKYRRHSKNISSYRGRTGMEDSLKRSAEFTTKLIYTLRNLNHRFGGKLTPFQDRLLRWDLAYNEFLNKIQSSANKVAVTKDILKVIRLTSRINLGWSAESLLLYFAYVLQRKCGLMLYGKFR